jgi:hypothetical protein
VFSIENKLKDDFSFPFARSTMLIAHEQSHHVCPWWVGSLPVNPLRRLLQNPDNILRPYAKRGMTVLEIGPTMGYFSLSLARFVGRGNFPRRSGASADRKVGIPRQEK